MSTILFVHNTYRLRAGEDVVADEIVRILEERGHRVVKCIASSREVERWPAPKKLRAGLQTLYSIPVHQALRRLVGRERPAFALVQNVFPLLTPSVYYALARCGVPIVQCVFNFRFVCPAGTLFTEGHACEKCVSASTLPCALHCCCQGRLGWSALYATIVGLHRMAGTFARLPVLFALAAETLRGPLVRGGLPGNRMVKIPNAFNASQYTPGTGPGDHMLYVGRLDPEKGVSTLLRAMEEIPSISLKIVGRGTEEASLRNRGTGKSDKRVEFLGSLYGETVVSLLQGARAVIVPSEWREVSPVIVQQAHACGRAVIATRIGGLPEMVEEGVDGLLVEPSDPSALAAAMRTLADGPDVAQAMGKAGRVRAEREYSTDRYYERLRDAVTRYIGPDLL